jgi:glycosyltransferase involved in cell wall biosynthesis
MLSFSIIVPTYERPRQLSQLLNSLARLEYDAGRYEVIVVDDGGSVSLTKIVSRFSELLNLTVLRQKNAGPAAARDFGVQHSQGEYLAFTDDDCVPRSDWLRALAQQLAVSPGSACGGKTTNALKDNPYSASTQSLLDSLHQSRHFRYGRQFFTANNMAVPRLRFLGIGGFDPTLRFGEDRDFCDRWVSAGYRLIYAPEAVVDHYHFLNLCSFVRLHYSYGQGTSQFWRRRSRRGSSAARWDSPGWYVDLVLAAFRKERNLAGLIQSLLSGVSQISNAAGILGDRINL